MNPSLLPCGHTADRANVYEHGGRRYCRKCRRMYDARYRANLRKARDELKRLRERA